MRCRDKVVSKPDCHLVDLDSILGCSTTRASLYSYRLVSCFYVLASVLLHFNPNPIRMGPSPPTPLVVFGLPFPQTTSDQPETFPLLTYTVDTFFDQKNFDRIPGRSRDRSFVRAPPLKQMFYIGFSDIVLYLTIRHSENKNVM